MRNVPSKIVKGRRSAATESFLYVLGQIKNALLAKKSCSSDTSLNERISHFGLWVHLILGLPRVYASLEVKASLKCAKVWSQRILKKDVGIMGVFYLWITLNYILYLFKWYLYENELTTKEAQHAYELVRRKIIPAIVDDRTSAGLLEVGKIFNAGLKNYDWGNFLAASGCLFDDNVCQLLSALLCVNNADVWAFSRVLVDVATVAKEENKISFEKVRYNAQRLLKSLRDCLDGYCDKMCEYMKKSEDLQGVQKWYLAKQYIWRIRAISPCPENERCINQLVSDFCRHANEAGALTCAVRGLMLSKMSKMPMDSLQECRERAAYFKECIENHDAYRLIEDITDEHALQLMFRFAWYGSKLDVNRECANGLGQCDYAISCGSKDKCIVEIKLGSNSSLSAGLKNQLKIYKMVNNTSKGIYLVVCKTTSEIGRCRKLAKGYGLVEDKDVFIVDATPKVSASKVR